MIRGLLFGLVLLLSCEQSCNAETKKQEYINLVDDANNAFCGLIHNLQIVECIRNQRCSSSIPSDANLDSVKATLQAAKNTLVTILESNSCGACTAFNAHEAAKSWAGAPAPNPWCDVMDAWQDAIDCLQQATDDAFNTVAATGFTLGLWQNDVDDDCGYITDVRSDCTDPCPPDIAPFAGCASGGPGGGGGGIGRIVEAINTSVLAALHVKVATCKPCQAAKAISLEGTVSILER